MINILTSLLPIELIHNIINFCPELKLYLDYEEFFKYRKTDVPFIFEDKYIKRIRIKIKNDKFIIFPDMTDKYLNYYNKQKMISIYGDELSSNIIFENFSTKFKEEEIKIILKDWFFYNHDKILKYVNFFIRARTSLINFFEKNENKYFDSITKRYITKIQHLDKKQVCRSILFIEKILYESYRKKQNFFEVLLDYYKDNVFNNMFINLNIEFEKMINNEHFEKIKDQSLYLKLNWLIKEKMYNEPNH